MEYAFLLGVVTMVGFFALGAACLTLAGLMHVAERATIRPFPHRKINEPRKKRSS